MFLFDLYKQLSIYHVNKRLIKFIRGGPTLTVVFILSLVDGGGGGEDPNTTKIGPSLGVDVSQTLNAGRS